MLMLLLSAGLPTHAAANPGPRLEWDFTVLLDGRPIGRHRFALEADGAQERTLASDAAFKVTLLGVPLYRYEHHAVERWRQGCLVSLSARTDDDGRRLKVRGEAREGRFDARISEADDPSTEQADSAEGCASSFAYWDPMLRTRSRLLNPQTGRFERLQASPLAPRRIEVRGDSVLAQGWRLKAASGPIDVWYSPEGDWIGLDTLVRESRQLSYRLQPATTP
jgi:hypothetical protein